MRLWGIAKRNLGRNRRRTVVTVVALAFGMSLCIATFGLTDGLSAQMIHSLTRLDLGHVQVHSKEFVEDRELSAKISRPSEIVDEARRLPHVIGASSRIYGFGLLSIRGKSAGVELIGVRPDTEKSVTELSNQLRAGRDLPKAATPWPARRALTAQEQALDQALTERAVRSALDELDELDELDSTPEIALPGADIPPGARAEEEHPAEKEPAGTTETDLNDSRDRSAELSRILSPRPTRPLPVLLGSGLADVLDAGVGSKLFVSAPTPDGFTETAFAKVVGVFHTGTLALDRHRVYFHITDLAHLLHSEGQAHEIALLVDASENAPGVAVALGSQLPVDLVVRPWDEIRPEIGKMIELNDVSTTIMVFVIFFVASLGVVNTMLMAVFERTREIGVLRAIGMSRGRIVGMILAESALMVALATGLGVAGGLGLDYLMVTRGVDLTSFTGGLSLGGVGIRPVIYGAITPKGVLIPVVVLATICFLASLYPAVRAARLEPAIGMRET